MKIIKHGDIEKMKAYKAPLLFECLNCGCVYETNSDECEKRWNVLSDLMYSCNCPDCGFLNVNDGN